MDMEQSLAQIVRHRAEVRAVDPAELKICNRLFACASCPAIFASSMKHLMKVASLPSAEDSVIAMLSRAFDAVGLALKTLSHPADADAIEQEVFPNGTELVCSPDRIATHRRDDLNEKGL